MLVRDPVNRASAFELLQHAFLRQAGPSSCLVPLMRSFRHSPCWAAPRAAAHKHCYLQRYAPTNTQVLSRAHKWFLEGNLHKFSMMQMCSWTGKSWIWYCCDWRGKRCKVLQFSEEVFCKVGWRVPVVGKKILTNGSVLRAKTLPEKHQSFHLFVFCIHDVKCGALELHTCFTRPTMGEKIPISPWDKSLCCRWNV